MTKMHADVTALADGLYMIDAHMEGSTERLSCYLYDTVEPVLIDAGPSTSFAHLVGVLAHLGVESVATVAVTHIHIDHAGAAGHFARAMPNTRIAVHHLGAPHLLRPARLWSSAARIYGEAQLLDNWGEMIPVPEDRLVVLNEGDRISLGGGKWLDVLDTPGHAKHHVTFSDATSGAMYVGDTAGICHPHGHEIQPNTPPPDFDPHLLTGQLRRMAALDPSFVGFAHFGPRFDATAALEQAERRVWEWVAYIEGLRGLDDDAAARSLANETLTRLKSAGADEAELRFHDRSAGCWDMHVGGVRRWLDRAGGADR